MGNQEQNCDQAIVNSQQSTVISQQQLRGIQPRWGWGIGGGIRSPGFHFVSPGAIIVRSPTGFLKKKCNRMGRTCRTIRTCQREERRTDTDARGCV